MALKPRADVTQSPKQDIGGDPANEILLSTLVYYSIKKKYLWQFDLMTVLLSKFFSVLLLISFAFTLDVTFSVLTVQYKLCSFNYC